MVLCRWGDEMKNQYFADVGDYGKYGLLRFLAKHGLTIAVNWYLTEDDESSNDGSIRGYLEKEKEKDRIYDPDLFDVLKEMNDHKELDVSLFEERKLIPGAIYYKNIVRPKLSEASLSSADKRSVRERWHQEALAGCAGVKLVFFDPDNGLKEGKPTARKDAVKFVYSSEAADYYDRDQDVVYYCHKGRRTPDQWEKAKNIMQKQCPDAVLMGVTYHRGTQRSYIFAVHPEREKMYRDLLGRFLKTDWKKCFTDEFSDEISKG